MIFTALVGVRLHEPLEVEGESAKAVGYYRIVFIGAAATVDVRTFASQSIKDGEVFDVEITTFDAASADPAIRERLACRAGEVGVLYEHPGRSWFLEEPRSWWRRWFA